MYTETTSQGGVLIDLNLLFGTPALILKLWPSISVRTGISFYLPYYNRIVTVKLHCFSEDSCTLQSKSLSLRRDVL